MSLPTFSQPYATMCLLNQTCSQSVIHLHMHLPTLKMVHALTSQLVDSGVVYLKGHFLTSVSLTLTPRQTNISSSQPVTANYESAKKRVYEQHILEVEHASFTPLVMSWASGFGREATSMYKRLASLLSTKWDQPYSKVMGWLHCQLSFSLLRSSILCIRGACSSSSHFAKPLLPVDLMTCESQVSLHNHRPFSSLCLLFLVVVCCL